MAKEKSVTFLRHEVACLIAFIRQSGGSFAMKEWRIMSKIDRNKTPSSYDHTFRALKNEADEILKKIQSGALDDVPTPSAKNPKGSAVKTTPVRSRAAVPQKTPGKRGRKAAADDEVSDDEHDIEPSSKKVKKEKNDVDDDGQEDEDEMMFGQSLFS